MLPVSSLKILGHDFADFVFMYEDNDNVRWPGHNTDRWTLNRPGDAAYEKYLEYLNPS